MAQVSNALTKKLDELKARAQAAQEAQQLAKLDDPKYQERFIAQAIKDNSFNRLQAIELTFKSIVELNPIKRTGSETARVWRNRYIYGVGDDVRILLNLLSGYRYAASEHKQLMLVELPISETLAGDVLDSLGTFSYFNTTYTTIVKGEKGDAAKVCELLDIIAAQLGLTLDLSKLTQANLDKIEAKAYATAEADQAKWEAAIAHNQVNGMNFTM